MDQQAMRTNTNLADQSSSGMLQLPLHHSDDPLPIHYRLRHRDFLPAHSHGSLRSPAQTQNLETILQLNAAFKRCHLVLIKF